MAEDSEFDFNVPEGTTFRKKHKARSAAKKDTADLLTTESSVLKKLKSKGGDFKVPSRGHHIKRDNNGRALGSTFRLDNIKKNTVLKSGLDEKPAGVSAEKIQRHCFETPSWLKQRIRKSRFEIYFEVGPDRMLDTRSLRVYFLPTPNWYEESCLRIDIKTFDLESYIAVASQINAAIYLPTAWSRLQAETKWCMVLKPRMSNDSRLPTNTGQNLAFNIEALRRKLPGKKWSWSFAEDTTTVDRNGVKTGGREKSGKDPRQILLIPKLLPSALYRLKPMPESVFKEKA
jgi:hypothetical protein